MINKYTDKELLDLGLLEFAPDGHLRSKTMKDKGKQRKDYPYDDLQTKRYKNKRTRRTNRPIKGFTKDEKCDII